MHNHLEEGSCPLDIICDAVELLRKRKLRADEDRIQTVLKPRSWPVKYLREKINDAAKAGKICKLMYKDNFGYRTAMRISDKMAMRIIPYEPEHPSEIPEYVYSLALNAIKLVINQFNNRFQDPQNPVEGVSGAFVLDYLKKEKKLLNYNQAGFNVVLCGLQQKNEIIKLKDHPDTYAIRTGENMSDAAPIPEFTAPDSTEKNIAKEADNVRSHSDGNATLDEGKETNLPPVPKIRIPKSPTDKYLDWYYDMNYGSDWKNKPELYEKYKKEKRERAEKKRLEELEELSDLEELDTDSSTSLSSDHSEDSEDYPEPIPSPKREENEYTSSDFDDETAGKDANDDSAEPIDNDHDDNVAEVKTNDPEEEPSESVISEPVSSAAGRRRRVNPRYINDFYLTSSTKGGRGSKDLYKEIKEDYAAAKLKIKARVKKCSECGAIIRDDLGVCLKCLFPGEGVINPNKPGRRKGYKRKVATPIVEPVVKSGKLARHTRVVRRSGAATRSTPQIDADTKGSSSGSRRMTVDSNEEINADSKSNVDKLADMEDVVEDTSNSIEDNTRISQDTPTSTGEQIASGMTKEDHKSKPRSKHNKDGAYKSFLCNNSLVTDKQQKPQLPLRFIPNRKRPEPDRSSGSNTTSSKKTCQDLESNIDDATATSILDIPTKQLEASANENNHSTNGIFVPSSTSCSLDDFEPQYWTSEDVAQFISSKGFTDEARLFREQDVDGLSLLLMQRADFLKGLSMKLGPALKIYDHICRLKENYLPICYL